MFVWSLRSIIKKYSNEFENCDVVRNSDLGVEEPGDFISGLAEGREEQLVSSYHLTDFLGSDEPDIPALESVTSELSDVEDEYDEQNEANDVPALSPEPTKDNAIPEVRVSRSASLSDGFTGRGVSRKRKSESRDPEPVVFDCLLKSGRHTSPDVGVHAKSLVNVPVRMNSFANRTTRAKSLINEPVTEQLSAVPYADDRLRSKSLLDERVHAVQKTRISRSLSNLSDTISRWEERRSAMPFVEQKRRKPPLKALKIRSRSPDNACGLRCGVCSHMRRSLEEGSYGGCQVHQDSKSSSGSHSGMKEDACGLRCGVCSHMRRSLEEGSYGGCQVHQDSKSSSGSHSGMKEDACGLRCGVCSHMRRSLEEGSYGGCQVHQDSKSSSGSHSGMKEAYPDLDLVIPPVPADDGCTVPDESMNSLQRVLRWLTYQQARGYR
ncbi:unnamed protein product [Calicophoron daubneyi]|uniref:Uncharacterized protein n=1 Tax=Calicophoron daubneyi TaxID=300641 RepID=A0AAV2TH91_CALDB